MKIKHLSIRNIASIEKAEIDFEKGLCTPGTDMPATLFLINGDTGAGKTVILDCISLALYGTTPRVKGVKGRTNNTFVAGEGQEISIFDVKQYTRLGISWRDECYARLRFEGNDGREYDSRFSLGITNRGNLRDAEWTLCIDGSEEVGSTRKKEIEKRVREAVGLSYEQFCRMAMLAQGQFAEFLTGGKEERERILEQLTSTEHFSRYGQAIDRIHKRKKKARDEAESRLCVEKTHLLRPEEERETSECLTANEATARRLETFITEIDKVLELYRSIRDRETRATAARNEIEAAEKERPELDRQKVQASEIEQTALGKLEIHRNVTAEQVKVREALNPNYVTAALAEAAARIETLGYIRKNIKNVGDAARDLKEEENRLIVEEARHAALAEEEKKSRELAAMARLAAEEASTRFTTMHLSVEKNFRELRNRLANEHAEICPLCGSSMKWGSTEELDRTFAEILTPLVEERDRLQEAARKAQTALEKLSSDLSRLAGEVNSRRKNIAKLKKQQEKRLKELKEGWMKIGCPEETAAMEGVKQSELCDIIDRKTAAERRLLNEKSAEAEKIYAEITRRREEEDRMRRELDRLTRLRTAAETAIQLNERTVTDRRATLAGFEKELEEMRHTLTASTSSLMDRMESGPKDESGDEALERLLAEMRGNLTAERDGAVKAAAAAKLRLEENRRIEANLKKMEEEKEILDAEWQKWDRLQRYFGGTRFRTLVQSHILRPLLSNANIYLERITDRFRLTCSDSNEQLAILVEDRYNSNQLRSATVLSGGERFMISLALSLALSAMNKADMNVDILFIDEGFGTLDAGSLGAVMETLRRLPEIAGQNGRRVGVISHREELADAIDVQIRVRKCGEGRSRVEISGN